MELASIRLDKRDHAWSWNAWARGWRKAPSLLLCQHFANVVAQGGCDIRALQGVGDRGCQKAQRIAGIVAYAAEAQTVAVACQRLLFDRVSDLNLATSARLRLLQ